ncbi:MAG TPA: hypothetical protein VJ824_07285 [Bacillota bacterium]|nr:hypothetical protein [Bacillota bacterium]
MKSESIDKWFEQEMNKSGLPLVQATRTPPYQKWIAYALVLGIPISVSGCSSQPTARDDCQWEKEHGHPEIQCDDSTTGSNGSSSNWYRSRGYKSSKDPILTGSPNYNAIQSSKGIGSGGKSSGG